MKKRTFSLLEMIIVLFLIAFIYTVFIPKNQINKLNEITNRISLYITYTRFKALIENKFDENDDLWHKKRWSIKFFRCRDENDGIYFSIYSDKNKSGHPGSEDSLTDPLTKKYIYSSNYCKENNLNSKYVLLTKLFDIKSVELSCNETTSLGQLSFGEDGKIYSKLANFGNESNLYEINEPCRLKLVSKNNKYKEIIIFPLTGFNKIE